MSESDFNSIAIRQAYSLKPSALLLTRDVEDANDLVQDTLLRAFLNRDKFAEDTNLKGWLFTIMKNIYINNYHKSKSRNAVIDSSKEVNPAHYSKAVVLNQGESNISIENVKVAITFLREELREPFMMYYEGFKYREIADRLTLAMGTVKSRIHFARKHLQVHLENN